MQGAAVIITAILGFLARAIVVKFIAALAIGVGSFTSYTYIVEELETMIVTAWGGLPATVIQLAAISGLTQAVGILLSAIAIRAAFMFLPRWIPFTGN